MNPIGKKLCKIKGVELIPVITNKLKDPVDKTSNKGFIETPSKEFEEKRNEQYKKFVKYYQNITSPKKEVNISAVDEFLNKYEKASSVIQILRKDLMSIVSDIHWIKESGNQNEQFALSFADALNALSVSI